MKVYLRCIHCGLRWNAKCGIPQPVRLVLHMSGMRGTEERSQAMIPDHPDIARMMRDGELGTKPPFRCKECGDGIWEGDTSYGGRCEICFPRLD